MSEKKYCCVPESYKDLIIYDAGTITNLENFSEIKPSSSFKYCIDDYDKVKIFFFDRQSAEGSTDDENYLKYKIIQSVKSIFKVSEIYNFQLFLDSEARAVFTVFYDINGNHIHTNNIVEKNRLQTVVGHRYTFILYKRYS